MVRKVIHILGSAQPEGTGTCQIVRSLAQNLDPERYQIHALFLAGTGPLVGNLRAAGIDAHAIEWQRGWRDPKGALSFCRVLRQQRFDIVHIHFGGGAVIRLARAASKAKIVRHLHGRILEPQGLAPVRFKFKCVDAVVAVSQAVADQIENSDVEVIYAGVLVSPTLTQKTGPGRELILGTAGRLVKLKGIEFLLEAAALLRPEFPSLQVEIAGSGPELEDLKAEVVRLGLGDHVRFLGWIDDLTSTLRGWDVFVMPSLEEGFPTAALNAMASGIPVVAAAVGGVPELIEDGVSGLLVRPRDVTSLAAALRLLLRQQDVRSRMGEVGFERVRDHFSARQMAAKFAGLYDRLFPPEGAAKPPA
jgi:glycosyltransferase involved in cell wall biosynthesis